MSQKDDLEDGEIAEETRNIDKDSRFGHNWNHVYINANQTNPPVNPSINPPVNPSIDRQNVSANFQLNSNSDVFLFGSRDTDLRFADNHFNDYDLRQPNRNNNNNNNNNNNSNNSNINRNNNNNNINNYPYLAQNPRKPNQFIRNTDCESPLRPQFNPNNSSFKLMPNTFNSNNNLRAIGLQEPNRTRPPFQLHDQRMPVHMRPQMRPTKALLPTPIMPEPVQAPYPPIRPAIRPQLDVPTNPHINPQVINTSHLLSQSNKLLPPFLQKEWAPKTSENSNLLTYLSPPLMANQNVLPTQTTTTTQTAVRNIGDSKRGLRTSTESIETKIGNFYDKPLVDVNRSTIVLGSDEIKEVQMIDECMDGSESPYDPEQEITSNVFFLETDNLSSQKSSDFKAKDETFLSRPQRERSARSDSEEKRLKRLLKSNNINDNDSHRSCPKKYTKKSKSVSGKDPNKSLNLSKSPARRCPHKVSGHRESCKKARSRRNFKRIRKRKVLTERDERSDLKPIPRNEILDASYEDLLEEYKRIQDLLRDLAKEEEKSKVTVLSESDKEEGEVVEQKDETVQILETNDDSKDDQITAGDDDELELRRLALESKKVRVQTVPSSDSQSLDNDELDENVLREQLLKSLSRAKSKTDSTNTDESVKETEVQSDLIERNSELEATNETQLSEEVDTSNKADQAPVVSAPKPKLIINFGDDSSDDEPEVQEVQKTSRKVLVTSNESTSSMPIRLESFLRQARMRSEPKSKTPNLLSSKKKATAIVGKLSITQQMEYQKLKAEIARREQTQVSDSVLKQNEMKWKVAKADLQEKIAKVNSLKLKVAVKRNALRKAQQHARKMQEAFIAATRVVSATAAEFHSLNEDLKNSENAVTAQQNNVNQFEEQCIRIGLKLQGNKYKLPIAATLKRNSKDSMSATTANRKRTKSESNQLSKQEIADEKKRLKELERIYSKRLQDLKNTALLRPSSPKTIGPKSPQIVETCDPNAEKTLPLSKVQESEGTLRVLVKQFLHIPQTHPLIPLDCFIELMFSSQDIKPLESMISVPNADLDVSLSFKSDSNTELYDSVLSHLHSYRFIENQPKDISSDHWTNNLNPLENICRYDLLGTCNDDKCLWQHIDKCLLDPTNKIVDLLLYDPKLAGLTSEIPETMDIKALHNIRLKLVQFAQKLINSNPQKSIEAHCREIVNQIRKRSKESVVCLLTRRIPKLFSASKTEVPFDDLLYKFSIKDKSLVLSQARVSELRLSADPDIYFKNRFYAPEGVPISAELETSLASDPNNIQLWIKLAYYHITKCSNNSFADSIDRALNVLSRALEHNTTDPQLYEHYLFIYSNRVVRDQNDPKFSLINVCRKVVKHCPHYRLWKCFLSLCTSFEDKNAVSTELLNNLINNIVVNQNFETRSHQILEVLMYKIHMYLQSNNYKLSLVHLSHALNSSSKEFLSQIQSLNEVANLENGFYCISDQLTDSDRVFGWLCFVNLLIYHSLPAHCFELFKQGFPQLINKNPFVFDWSALIDVINAEEIRIILNTALVLCYPDIENQSNIDRNSLAIHINLAELNRYDAKQQNNSYEDLVKLTQNDPILWPLIVEHGFKSYKDDLNLIKVLKESPIYSSGETNIYFNVATHYYEMEDFTSARNELFAMASNHYNCHLSHPILKLAFETLLFEDDENNHNFELINARKSKGSRSAILWLSYILLLKIDSYSEQEIDSAFQSALALCSIEKTSVDLQLLWSNYLKFLMTNITNQKQFLDLFGLVRHCCLTVSDPTFQIQIVSYFCKILSNNDKLNALVQFAKLIPENIYITMYAITFALQINRKETCWVLINSIIFDKKVRLQCPQFWQIAIALAIEKSDHLSVHKFFQMAISLLPYNTVLWQAFKTYETSIKHVEHLKQAKDVCDNQLKISQNIF